MTAVQRDDLRFCWRRIFSRWRRTAKLSTSSAASSAAVASGSGACSIGGTSDGPSVIATGPRAHDVRAAQLFVSCAGLARRRCHLRHRFALVPLPHRRNRRPAGGAGSGRRLGSCRATGCSVCSLDCASASAITLSTKALTSLAGFGAVAKPGGLAARAAHGTAARADRGRVDSGRTWRRWDKQSAWHQRGLECPKPTSRPLMDRKTMGVLGESRKTLRFCVQRLWLGCDNPVKARFLAWWRPRIA